jgi:hypothetical protein
VAGEGLDRRTFLKAGALGAAAGAAGPTALALANHYPPELRELDPTEHGEGGGPDEGDLPTPSEINRDPGPMLRTVHEHDDVEIVRYQANLDANDFGVTADPRTGLVYVTQRLSDNIVVFDRAQEKFTRILPVPTNVSGGHTVKFDAASNSLWFAAGEASKIGRLVLSRHDNMPHNFVEYSTPGNVRAERKPHGIVVLGNSVWFTDDRQDRVGWVDISTGEVFVLPETIEADGINVEDRRSAAPPRRRGRRRGRRGRRRRRRAPSQVRIWVAGGATLTGIDAFTKRVVHEVPILQEPGVSQLRLHDVHYDARLNRIWVLARGADHIYWLDADRPDEGTKGEINPGQFAAGLDHMDLGETNVWWTEGLANNVTRHDPANGETRSYKVPTPVGYFNPHGIEVVKDWKEVWFTERESICRLRFKDGRAP